VLSFIRHLTLGILLASFNLFSSLVNIHFLLESDQILFASLSLALLWTPGVVTSLGFLVLYARGNKAINKLLSWKLVVYPVLLLIFYPVIPICLTLAYLFSKNEVIHERSTLAKFFAGFLDHGPNFVLRLVIVVLVGISQNGIYSRGDIVFIMSMISSFCSFILTALWFNERVSSWARWLFLSGPMYSAVFACRAFTLAVFIKETLHDQRYPLVSVLLVILFMFVINFGLFIHCGQDLTRSAVFGVASVLLPAGYNNDFKYYQVPKQDILQDPNKTSSIREDCSDGRDHEVEFSQNRENFEMEEKLLVPMRSSRFLFLHTIVNTVLMFTVAVYLLANRDDSGGSMEERDAIVIPQLLGVIPGLFFTVGTAILMPEERTDPEGESTCRKICKGFQKGSRLLFSVILSFLGFLSLMPAFFWTLMYKWFTQEDLKSAILSKLNQSQNETIL